MKILHNDLVYSGIADLKRITYQYTDTLGRELTDTREIYAPRDAAAVLLYNTQHGTVLLTRQLRIATWLNGHRDGFFTEVCAGRIEQEETALETVIRETEEECGYRISDARPVFSLFMSPGVSTVKTHLFLASYDATQRVSEGGGLSGENEAIELLEMPFNQAIELVNKGEIADAKTVILLQYAQLAGILPPRI